MSLAVESYCTARVSDLRTSLENERGESDRLRKLAVTDWLTKLHNHSYSRGCLETAIETVRSNGSSLCVLMADLDHFKDINDAHGHLVGDEILKITAGRMAAAARTGDEVCRYGGEEFLFILRDTELADGAEVAERIRTRICSDAMNSGDTRISLTVSLGLAQAHIDDTINSLIERADEALYAAKSAGRNCVRIASNLEDAA
jgi:diguanylate cyclase (GGDEF)-like protein